MRGEILEFDRWSGEGLISGEDGVRYGFFAADIQGMGTPQVGGKVDFVLAEGKASNIYVLAGAGPMLVSSNEDLGLWGYFAKCMRLYFNGSGRARRKEYWSFILFRALFMLGFLFVGLIAILTLGASAHAQDVSGASAASAASMAPMLVGWILGLPFLAPHYAVSARRLHDVGLTGWLALLMLIPYLGALFMFIIALIPSQRMTNRYGKYPMPLTL